MAHGDAGNYGGKHSGPANKELRDEVLAIETGGTIGCAEAHELAGTEDVSPLDVGKAIDFAEIKIRKCQLGLFGYEEGKRIIVSPADSVVKELENLLREKSDRNRISCAELWEIAAALHMEKMEMTAACEALGIKIIHCQLGAF